MAAPWLVLRLPHRNVAARVSSFFRFGNSVEFYDFNHIGKADVAFPQGLESRHAITLAVEVSAQLGNENDSCTKRELGYAVFFFASNSSTLHSQRSKTTSHGNSGTSRPSKASSM